MSQRNYHARSIACTRRFGVALLGHLMLAACATPGPYQMELMPAPGVFDEERFIPFAEEPDFSQAPYHGMLYATDREPAPVEHSVDPANPYYTSRRGNLLRLGVASVQLGSNELSREHAQRMSFQKARGKGRTLQVTGIDELGVLDRSMHPFVSDTEASPQVARRFAELIDRKLVLSRQKDVFIYVHGYKVGFENPVLVATELWHYLGNDGVFIAFAWPATASRWAYFFDAESTAISARQLRVLLEYLAEETSAEHIHIVGYSQGTRVVMQALHALTLKHADVPAELRISLLKLGDILLIASDIERQRIGAYLADGLLDTVGRLTLYASSTDKALKASQRLWRRERTGQTLDPESLSAATLRYLREHPRLILIDVTEAADAAIENGHRYFRKSPWVSSDLLVSLKYGLTPADRGLVQMGALPVWTFPPDYLGRLREAFTARDNAYAE